MSAARSLIFILLVIIVSYLLCRNKKEIRWKFVGVGLLVQLVVAFLFIRVAFINDVLKYINNFVLVIEKVTLQGTQFMFGFLAGGIAPYELVNANANYIVAFRVLPLIIVISAISSVLFHWRILPMIIGSFSAVLIKLFKISGSLGFGAASTVFFGTIEAPLLIRPYLLKMNKGELLALLSCTMATIAGTVMVLYSAIVGEVVPDAIAHMITASVISVPAALIIAHLIIPSAESDSLTQVTIQSKSASTMDALITGTVDGLNMVLQIIAVIIVLFALVYLGNYCIALMAPDWTLEKAFGILLQPLVWLMGIPWDQAALGGELMATKIILNEFVAYSQLSSLGDQLSSESITVMTYALCGFANIASVGIIVGGLSSILPERKAEIGSLALISLGIGNAATMMTACIFVLLR